MNIDEKKHDESPLQASKFRESYFGNTSRVRRSLVKAAAISPVILTLRSGAAAAMTSAESCIVKDQQAAQQAAEMDPVLQTADPSSPEPEESLALTSHQDGWLRSPVVVRNIRRVRKKKGKWIYKGKSPYVKVYTHQPKGRFSWWSYRNKRRKKSWNYRDSGQLIDIYDPTGKFVLLTGGILMFRGPTKKIRYVGIPEQDIEQYGLVALDESGAILQDEEGMPAIGMALEGGALQSNHITASCWLSLNPNIVT